jgi:hypothetical protein
VLSAVAKNACQESPGRSATVRKPLACSAVHAVISGDVATGAPISAAGFTGMSLHRTAVRSAEWRMR